MSVGLTVAIYGNMTKFVDCNEYFVLKIAISNSDYVVLPLPAAEWSERRAPNQVLVRVLVLTPRLSVM